jgi:hypothetical protein
MANDANAKPESAKPATVAEKLNKSGNDPLKEFKLGVDVIDRNVSKIDSGVRAISKKIRGNK